MRVALVSETFSPAVNGVVTSVLRAAEHLALRGHDPVVIAPSGSSYESRCGARVQVHAVRAMRLPRYRELPLAAPTAEVAELLGPGASRRRPPGLTCRARLGGCPGRPAARHPRGRGVPDRPGRLRRAVPRAGRIGDDVAVAAHRARADGADPGPSSATIALLRAHGIGSLALWARGVDREQFTLARRSTDLRSGLALGGELLVGTVARLAVEKRLHLLGPLSRLPGVRLVVVGDGPQRRALARALPRAVFAGGVRRRCSPAGQRTWGRLGEELIGHYERVLGMSGVRTLSA